jgi:secreted trypsin-like serine protease
LFLLAVGHRQEGAIPTMAILRLKVGRYLLALAVAAGAAGPMCGTAGAQGTDLVFEKELDLSLNPARESGVKEVRAVAGLPLDGRALSLPALVPAIDASGGRSARIIMGTPAKAGAWRSALNIGVSYVDQDGKEQGSLCGATLIDELWALTAAHCVFRVRGGGVRTLRWVTAYADDVRFQKGKVLRVKAVYVHRGYDEAWILNDVALLRLEAATGLPRQKLAGGSPSAVLQPGTMATVIGWGRTKGDVQGSLSPVLLQASLPIARKDACDAFRQPGTWPKPGRPLTDAEFCAGHGGGENPMTCNGDSGGPLFVSSALGEPLQAGIVSWTRGPCLSTYGAFASAGHFEAWIKRYVPNAVFVMPQPAVAQEPLATIAGARAGGPPAPLGQCAIEVYADGVATNSVRIGASLSVRVTTGVTGQLAVFSRTSAGKFVQLFPNRYGRAGASGTVRAGDVVGIAEGGDGLSLKVSPPDGRYHLIAMVMPEGGGLASLAQRHSDMAPIEGFGSMVDRLADEARQLPADTPRAVCTRQFDVE